MKQGTRSIVTVLIISFAVCFMACAVLVVLLGGKIFARSTQVLDRNFNQDVPLLYIVEKIRQHDESGGINVLSFQSNDVLVFDELIEGQHYHTYLYVLDDGLYEVLLSADDEFDGVGGQLVAPIKALTIKYNQKLWQIGVTTLTGESQMIILNQRSLINEK